MPSPSEEAKVFKPLQSDSRVITLRKRYEEIRTVAARASRIVSDIADPYTEGLDTIVSQIEVLLDEAKDGKRKEFSDFELRRLVLRIPTLIYRAVSVLDTAAIEASISKAVNKSTYSEYYLDTDGTIPEREAFATLKAAEESVVVDLARHVYNRVKGKIDAARDLQDGIKKVMTSKDTELQVFGRTK